MVDCDSVVHIFIQIYTNYNCYFLMYKFTTILRWYDSFKILSHIDRLDIDI